MRLINRAKKIIPKNVQSFLITVKRKSLYLLDFGTKNLGDIYNIYENKKLNSTKKVCLFSQYDENSKIPEHVLYTLKQLKHNNFDIVIITTSEKITENDKNLLYKTCSTIIHRENIGRDFGSWTVGINYLNNLNIKPNNILLINDSQYFPLYEMKDMFTNMALKNYDMWGITDSYERKYHIQSYFLMCNSKIINSAFWKNYWNKFKIYKNKDKTIDIHEIGITQRAKKNKFEIGVYCDYLEVIHYINENITDFRYHHLINDGVVTNPTHFLWDILVKKFKCPIIKVELLKKNPGSVYNIDKYQDIVCDTNYDVSLIKKHLKEEE